MSNIKVSCRHDILGILTALALVIGGGQAFGQVTGTMVNTGKLFSTFNEYGITLERNWEYLSRAERKEFAAYDEDKYIIDSTEEFLSAIYFYPEKIQVVNSDLAVALEQELPHSDPITAGLKLGAMWYKKWVELKFTDPANAQQLANYELAINTICARTGVTRTAIEDFYRRGVKDVVSEAVDRAFNAISFMANGGGKSFNTVLTRNADNSYTLRYEGTGTNGQTKELTAASLDALLAVMARSTDFNTACIDVVRQKQQLIPAFVFADWQAKYAAIGDGVALTKEALTNFYLNPTKENYDVLLGIYSRSLLVYRKTGEKDAFAIPMMDALSAAIGNLSSRLSSRFVADASRLDPRIAALIPKDSRYNIFSTPYELPKVPGTR